MHLTTLKYRLKDSSIKNYLNKCAGNVNFVWNYCNEMSIKRYGYNNTYLSGYDFNKLTAGCSKELNLHSQTIQFVGEEYAARRKQFKKTRLNWRTKKRSLGWVPFKNLSIKLIEPGKFRYNGKIFRYWNSKDFHSKIKCGSFNQDSMGKWYVCFVVEIDDNIVSKSNSSIGIDLGLKTTATYSNGEKFDGLRTYRKYEGVLSNAQKAKKKKRTKSINAKISNIRKDSIHKETTKISKSNNLIFIGNVSSKKLLKTNFAKSVNDAGWGMYRDFLKYKAARLGGLSVTVNENYSTVTCSECLNKTFPGGLSSLGVREWVCSNCGHQHDRDVNAAKNILRMGLHTLKEELSERKEKPSRAEGCFPNAQMFLRNNIIDYQIKEIQ